ncbi:HlyD family secretion protein [Burkholderia multivorans]|uniref:HlyD family secretion protein n=3 Tax=Burkholderia multivorans TaxID=87883 RepID=UPI001C21964D|nr:HlyD family secretion protein [Burkholderia multivorans]MBU9204031.1 HlyD family secretion protein [Burkholderia multivorans]MCO8352137.1 HlyD family secretion protein [Burkholderia multivorans]MCO8433574.1 HlyD family secretion protein [Burkholderia multivorans]MCO8459574.1 HlyD family secretion protein [Burkholderia multivorans]MDN7846075.1 HlyD family secretion protein [Burkholderia multivorans]
MSEVTVSPLPDRLRDRVAPTRASPLARPDARTRIARGGVRRRASARTADAPLDREPGGAPVRVARAGDDDADRGSGTGSGHGEPRGERDADAPGGGGGDGHPHDDRGGRTGGDGDGAGDGGERKRPGRKPLIILGAIALLIVVGGLVWWFATRNQESTDDAYTDGNAIAVAPHVSGYVTRLAVDDNVYVHRGDVLVEIDPRDYRAQVDAAHAQLGLAEAQLDAARVQLDIARVQYPAQYRQARAQIESAEAAYRQALAAQARQRAVDVRATSQQAIDAADAQRASADANVAMAQAQARTASLVPQQIRQAETVVEERRQQVLQARAQLEQAELNLAYCTMRAPSDGWVTRRNVQLGSFLQPGTSIFSIVTPRVWITANFKESQLKRMRVGDRVDVSVDAYPDLDLHGHVDSIQLGSGSRFSAFPAENATGNFVKIVQRVPVKIVLDGPLPRNPPLGLGLSVEPTVHLK